MATTPIAALPYPALTDSPNEPAQVQSLALALDPLVTPRYASAAARDAAVPAPTEGHLIYRLDLDYYQTYTGTAWVQNPVSARGILTPVVQITADTAQTSGGTQLDVVSAAAVTPAESNRIIKITTHWRSIVGTVGGDNFEMRIIKDGTQIEASAHRIVLNNVGHLGGTMTAIDASPTVAAHTYKLAIARAVGTGTGNISAAATYPCFILVEDIGHA